MKISFQELRAMSVEQRLFVFVSWLRQQPRNEAYNFSSNNNCALCRFGVRALGIDARAGGNYLRESTDYHMERAVAFSATCHAPVGSPLYALANCTTLGELYDCLSPHVTPPLLPTVELSEAALEALELRPLVSFERTKA